MASIERPNPGRAYNLCDDKPASAEAVLLYAAELTGLTPPAPTAFDDLPASTKRFYADNKRVANARAKAELGWRLKYPTYRDGLGAIYRGMQKS
jgi:nucleoside-diphosphate-sugar epimerase